MRKINPHDFKVARRGTSREINRQIALNLIRTHQPISRADLARADERQARRRQLAGQRTLERVAHF